MAKRKKKATKNTSEAPTSSCLLLCEDVTVSLRNNLHTLHGVVSEMFVPRVPTMSGVGVAYIRFSNVYANQQIVLTIEHAETQKRVYIFPTQAPPDSDPLGNIVIILRIPPFEISHSGRYIFSANHNDISFAECVITVRAPSDFA